MSEWQPIETAPKSGPREPLIVASESQVDVAYGSGEWWHSLIHLDSYDGSSLIIVPPPTHWMPLPELPVTKTTTR